MKHHALYRAVRSFTGSVFATALLATPLYAVGDEPAQSDTASTMDCQRYSGTERTDCERRMSESRSSEQRSTTAATSQEEDQSDASADATTSKQTSSRTRVSRADTEENRAEERERDEGDSKYWDSTREAEPGEVRGADMHSVPPVNREDANSELADPYQVSPGTDAGLEEPNAVPEGVDRDD